MLAPPPLLFAPLACGGNLAAEPECCGEGREVEGVAGLREPAGRSHSVRSPPSRSQSCTSRSVSARNEVGSSSSSRGWILLRNGGGGGWLQPCEPSALAFGSATAPCTRVT